ncbi:MAG: FtsW/RodA/SpoVE family cell cycle protein [Christensenellaceae bacterium]|jgi:rod shape determining protein RodA
MEAKKTGILKRIDWILVVLTLAIFIAGLLSVASATLPAYTGETTVIQYIGSLFQGYPLSQLIYFFVGLLAVVILMLWDYTNMKEFTNYLYGGMVIFLAAVLIFGSNVRGMVGWFMIGSVGIQPAEVCKPIMIVVLAKEFASRTEGQKEGIGTFRGILPMVWRFLIPFLLICMQPDWGTAMVYAFILLGMLFMTKTSFKVLGPIIGSVLVMLPIAWLLMSTEQKARIAVFLDPTKDPLGSGYNMIRAKTVAGAGGISGKGLFSPDLLTQRTNYLPEKQTDFIFSATIEAIGFVGGAIIILLYLAWIFRMLYLSTKAKDDFGSFIILGVTFMFLFHIIENIGMNIGVLPVTGIPLPFFSVGGSNLLASMLSVGLVLNVNMRRARRLGQT